MLTGMKVSEQSLSAAARRFATIFRREASRTATVVSAIVEGREPGYPASVAASMFADMNGYDLWAAAAFDLLLKNGKTFGKMSMVNTLCVASGLSRATMSEVAFCEARMAQGQAPWSVGSDYNRLVKKSGYSRIRAFPSTHAVGEATLLSMLTGAAHAAPRTRHAKGRVDPVGLMLVDKPWVLPKDVWSDPEYKDAGRVPPASFGGKEIDFDPDGLLKRVGHELLVMEAAFDDAAMRKLTEDD
jgi:hypothetical protein